MKVSWKYLCISVYATITTCTLIQWAASQFCGVLQRSDKFPGVLLALFQQHQETLSLIGDMGLLVLVFEGEHLDDLH